MAILQSFANWAKRVKWGSTRLRSGVASGWKLFDAPEITLVRNVKSVDTETRKGILGSSMVGTRTVKLNPSLLGSNGLMWGATLLHEAEHAIGASGEERPTRREFKFLGRLYQKSLATKRGRLAREALRGGVIAMKQRQRMVEKTRREGDRELLLRSGFTEKAVSLIMGMGEGK